MQKTNIIIVIATVIVASVVSDVVFRTHAWSTQRSGTAAAPAKDPSARGRELRRMMLTTRPQDIGLKPTNEFPRVYALLMDWPLGDQIATVFSASTGDASLYTTSAFGVIGGGGHEAVKTAAKALVRASDRHLTAANPTTEFPYPGEGHVRFYLLTFDGVRVIETDLASVTNGTGKYAHLFGLGQGVLAELRLMAEKKRK
jgi:hypothetical protein